MNIPIPLTDIQPREAFYLRSISFYQKNLKPFETLELIPAMKQLFRLYSLGYPLDWLRSQFLIIIDKGFRDNIRLNLNQIEEYQIALSICSLANLWSLQPQKRKSLEQLINPKHQDKIIQFLLNPDDGPDLSLQLMYVSPYLYLNMAIQNREGNETSISKFLSRYYRSMRQCSWYDSHLKNEDLFFGYWSFELAAIVKLLHLDDSAFAGHMFYPRDLTNQEFLPTWEDSDTGEKAREKAEELAKIAAFKQKKLRR